MKVNETFNLLQRVEIFNEIPQDLLSQFSENLKIDILSDGAPVIRKGDTGNSMYVIAKGAVKVHDGEHTVANLKAGSFFGEFSLLDDAPRSMSVTATEELHLIKISRADFFELFQSRPEVGQKIISTLTGRLRTQNESIIDQLRTREAELSKLVDERTKELKARNEEITIKNREITDNVNYARRIQAAILPDIKQVKRIFPESFVLYIPKDIVSGDFYSIIESGDTTIVVAADCTGHGVTGAFLSVVGSSLLAQIIVEQQIRDPGLILDKLNDAVIHTLNQRNSDSNDGMDVAACSFNKRDKTLQFAGANRPLWLIRNGELIEFKADKFPIGGLQIVHEENYRTHAISLKEKDTVYIFSDGYADQFGGQHNKKLMIKKFKEFLISIQSFDLDEQKDRLEKLFHDWKGKNEQVDDVLIIGIRI